MRGAHAFCPESGAALSAERHYVAERPQRHSTSGDADHGGLLTNGELVSSREALLRYFEACHREHADAADAGLYRAAALALVRLKRTEAKPWDVWVWVALQERLARKGFDAGWMTGHATARCPRCAGRLAWERDPAGDPRPRCVGSCDADAGLLDAMVERVRALYASAFEPVEELRVLDD